MDKMIDIAMTELFQLAEHLLQQRKSANHPLHERG